MGDVARGEPDYSSTECMTAECTGRMIDVVPAEEAVSPPYRMAKIRCIRCLATAWRITGFVSGGGDEQPDGVVNDR